MTRRTAIAVLRRAFAALTKRERGNLRYHAAKGTPVLCGAHADYFFSDEYCWPAPQPEPGGA